MNKSALKSEVAHEHPQSSRGSKSDTDMALKIHFKTYLGHFRLLHSIRWEMRVPPSFVAHS